MKSSVSAGSSTGRQPVVISTANRNISSPNPLNDSHINTVHLPSFFCVVSSDFAGFWDG